MMLRRLVFRASTAEGNDEGSTHEDLRPQRNTEAAKGPGGEESKRDEQDR